MRKWMPFFNRRPTNDHFGSVAYSIGLAEKVRITWVPGYSLEAYCWNAKGDIYWAEVQSHGTNELYYGYGFGAEGFRDLWDNRVPYSKGLGGYLV
jgi:hypothetical protein